MEEISYYSQVTILTLTRKGLLIAVLANTFYGQSTMELKGLMQIKSQLSFTIKIKIMVLDRDLTIQELLFNKPIEINKTAHFEAGSITADLIAEVIPTSMDLDATQFHDDPTFLDKLVKHLGNNWGWYAGAAAVGIVAYYSMREKKKNTSNRFIPFTNTSI